MKKFMTLDPKETNYSAIALTCDDWLQTLYYVASD
jgi:hypothetical protein